jgi:CheY-like chemotaxis protein
VACEREGVTHPRKCSLGPTKRLLSGNERTIPLCDPSMFWVQRLFADFGVGLNGGCLATSSIRILVVDDFEPWRHQVCSMLQTSPELRVVAQAGDGLEAVRKAQELKPDSILLDIGLPNLDGLQAANQIRQVAPDATIIFLTQNSDRDVVQRSEHWCARICPQAKCDYRTSACSGSRSARRGLRQ